MHELLEGDSVPIDDVHTSQSAARTNKRVGLNLTSTVLYSRAAQVRTAVGNVEQKHRFANGTSSGRRHAMRACARVSGRGSFIAPCCACMRAPCKARKLEVNGYVRLLCAR